MWKYDHIDETRQRLLLKGIIDLGGEVDEAMAMYVRDALMILATNDNPDIKVIIISDGGDVRVGLAIYDMLKSYHGKIIGIISGFCRSFAMVVLQACGERLSLPHSRMNIHDILVDIEKLKSEVILDPVQLNQYCESLVHNVRQDQQAIDEIYSLRSGQPLEVIRQLSGKNRNLTAQEALEFGLIDKIVEQF